MKRTAQQWWEALARCGVKEPQLSTWAPVFADSINDATFSRGEDELVDWLGQILHESNKLTALTENMNYSAQRLTEVWPGRFKTLADAQPYAHNPEALANRVYGGRMGNKAPGDGWKYRARTPIGLTGFDNYAHVGLLMGQDLINQPELLEQPHYALEACLMWWEDTIPDSMIGDPEKITQKINGGLIGLAERIHSTQLAEGALDCPQST